MSDERQPTKTPPPDTDPAGAAPAQPPARIEPVVVPRWIQAVTLPIGLLALWALARAAGVVLLLFVIAAVIALILNPVVKLVQRGGIPRGLAVFAVYIGLFAMLAGAGVLLANPISDQATSFQRDVPNLVDSANGSLASVQDWLDRNNIGIHVKDQGSTALETLQRNALRGSGDIVSFGRDLVRTVVEASLALILILVLSIYMLIYGDRIGALVRRTMPPGDGTPEDDFPIRVQKAVSGYVRGQLTFSVLMGVGAGVALWIFGAAGVFPDGKRYALAFGAFFGVMELIPYVGPILGALPPILVALFQDPLTAVWVGLLFVGIQQVEGHVVAPQVFGQALRINPLLVIFALLLGAQLYGIVGALVSLPIAAVARETVVYLREHLVLEPWGTPSAAELGLVPAGGGGGGPPPDVAAPCPECGAATTAGDAHCRACGAELQPAVGSPQG